MKRKVLAVLLAVMMIIPLLQTTMLASANAEQLAAQTLNKIGLLLGSGSDAQGNPTFGLDNSLRREDGIVMLLRLLGVYEEALASEYDCPFEDVTDTYYSTLLGYAYEKGYTKGVSDTMFAMGQNMNATQYLTIVLRSKGYVDGIDFVWDAAWELTDELGITNGEFDPDNNTLLRGDVAVVSLKALFVPSADGTTLFETLVEAGVLDEDNVISLIESLEDLAEAGILSVEQLESFQEAVEKLVEADALSAEVGEMVVTAVEDAKEAAQPPQEPATTEPLTTAPPTQQPDPPVTGPTMRTVTFDLNGGMVGTTTGEQTRTVANGQSIGSANFPVPTRADYELMGWFYVSSSSEIIQLLATTNITADVTVTAVWRATTIPTAVSTFATALNALSTENVYLALDEWPDSFSTNNNINPETFAYIYEIYASGGVLTSIADITVPENVLFRLDASTFTIASGTSLTIPASSKVNVLWGQDNPFPGAWVSTMINQGTIINNGSIDVLYGTFRNEADAAIDNNGVIRNLWGTFTNSGTISGPGLVSGITETDEDGIILITGYPVIHFSGIPEANAVPPTITSTTPTRFTVESVEWYNDTTPITEGGVLAAGRPYIAAITLKAEPGYKFTTGTIVATANADGPLTFDYEWTSTTLTFKAKFE
jgi:hypothetical protein